MLVLTRRNGERICIGDGIVLTVLRVHGERVRLGIEAPRDISVDRQEVRRRKAVEGERPSPAGRPSNRRQHVPVVEEWNASARH